MLYYTAIARVTDGLILAASMSTHNTPEMSSLKEQARLIIQKLNPQSPGRMSIETGAYVFSYMIEEGVCYLTLSELRFPRRLAFAYLNDTRKRFIEFVRQTSNQDWKHAIATVGRPYQFIRFDIKMQAIRREYENPDSRTAHSKLNEELSEVHSIMKRNIQEVLDRGERLENVSQISSQLRDESKKYKWGAKKLNALALLRQYVPLIVAAFIVIFVIYFRFFY